MNFKQKKELSVWLVDDNDTDNLVNRRVIEISGFSKQVTIKNSGKEALILLESLTATPEQLPDLIFLDLNMPIVDGFVFLYEFEKNPIWLENIKIVILSSSNSRSDMNRIAKQHQHVVKYIPKPLIPEKLEELSKILATLD
jgi:CheY-like chemotaxis protein